MTEAPGGGATTTPAPQVDSARGWLMTGATFVSTFVVFGVAYSFGAFFDSMSDEFGSGKGLTALLFSATTFLYFESRPTTFIRECVWKPFVPALG